MKRWFAPRVMPCLHIPCLHIMLCFVLHKLAGFVVHLVTVRLLLSLCFGALMLSLCFDALLLSLCFSALLM